MHTYIQRDIRIRANARDWLWFQDSVFYTLVNSQPTAGINYFLLGERNGMLSLKKPLSAGTSNTYRITVMASDDRGKNANASVVITISRDQQPPVWSNTPYRAGTVSENKANQSGIYTIKANDADLKGEIIYEVLGEYPAPKYFTVGRTSGVIRVNGNIKTDPLRLMSYTVSSIIFPIQTCIKLFQYVVSMTVTANVISTHV